MGYAVFLKQVGFGFQVGFTPGAVYVYRYNGTTWLYETKWTSDLSSDSFGYRVAIHGSYAAVGAHMDKDPEDARYNFFRWNASDQGYAIGPSRTNPMTGEILDADVVLAPDALATCIDMLHQAGGDITGIPTGYNEFDKLTAGL